MPLLVLCDPGCAATVGVSQPAGASVADGCPSTGHAPVITASSNTRAEGYVRVIVFSSGERVCPKHIPHRRDGACSAAPDVSTPPTGGWVERGPRRQPVPLRV